MVLIGGAGMAGLVAAARLRELGVEATVLEKGNRPGGSMLLSSGVVWRHRSLGDFRAECPSGDPALQALIVDRLDDGLAWLESVGRGAGAPRDGESANDRHTVRPAPADGGARQAGGGDPTRDAACGRRRPTTTR